MMASPDLSSLYYLLSNSLSQQEQLRKEAEAQLEQVAASQSGDASVRQAAAVYFKNLVNKRYDPYEEGKVVALSDEDKTQIRTIVVSAVMECSPVVRPQLIAATHKIIRADFPKRWPNLVEELYPLITCGEAERVISALAIFHEVVAWHGGTAVDDTRELIHGRMFPVLLSILQTRMEMVAKLEKEAVIIVKSILKSFHAAIQYRFSTHLLLGDAFSNWCTAVTHVIQLAPPAEILALSGEETEAHIYWKMKKWAVRIHNKIFQRYGCAKLDSFNNPDNMPFAKFYMDQVALPVLGVYLGQIELSLQGKNSFSERIFSLLTEFLESCIRHKKTWEVVQKHAMDLVSHFMFPRICFTEEDQEMWEADGEEYVRTKLDPFEEIYSAQSASINFILDLIKCRKKTMFVPILQFVNQTMSTVTSDIASQRRKDGALFIMGSIASVLMASDFKNQIEPVVASFVIPELASPQGFLRMRACWTLEQYDEMEYSQAVCMGALQGVLTCLTDKELPVKVAATGALGALLDNDTTQKALPPYLGKIMESILALANEIQLDSLSFVLERLVQMFADELAPYSVQLCVQLRDTVARNLEGYQNVLDVDAADDNFGQNADKMMAVVGMFKAIETLIDSMGKTPELVTKMEEVVLPLLAMVLDRRIIDVYEEAFELIDSITFSRKHISPSLWTLFPFIHRAFKDCGADYIQDMQTTLDNIISYGSTALMANTEYMNMLMDIVRTTMTSNEFSEYDRVYGCRLMESLMLNCRGHMDSVLGEFIAAAGPTISDPEECSQSVVVHHLEVIINALYYNAGLTLQHLERLQLTAPFFTLWFSKAERFSRVHDKRLIIVSLSTLMTLSFSHLPPFLQQNWRFVLPVYLSAIQTLPKALEERRKLEEEDQSVDDSDYDELSDGDYDEIHDDGPVEQEEEFVPTTRKVNEQNYEDYSDDESYEDDLEEEVFFETPLDTVDVSTLVQQSLAQLQTQPESFQQLTHALTPEQAVFLQSLLSSH